MQLRRLCRPRPHRLCTGAGIINAPHAPSARSKKRPDRAGRLLFPRVAYCALVYRAIVVFALVTVLSSV